MHSRKIIDALLIIVKSEVPPLPHTLLKSRRRLKMSAEIAKVGTVELIRELEKRLRCNEVKTEK